MTNSINYVKIKREKEGKCNICGNFSTLTWDHVPPKKAIFFRDVEIVSIFNKHSIDGHPREYSQNGTKFRTICGMCNNMLGTNYDVDFIEFFNEVSQKVYIEFTNKEHIACKIKPVKFIKSLFGHLLAAKGDYEESLIDIEMRKFVQNDDLWLPPFNVFYWFYPYPNIEVVRDLAICKLNGGNNTEVFSMLKMYPIAFYITKEKEYNNFKNLKDYCSCNIDEYVDISIDISRNKVVNSDWPIIVDDNTIILAGKSINSSVVSIPRQMKRQVRSK